VTCDIEFAVVPLNEESVEPAKTVIERLRLQAMGTEAAERRSAERTPFFGRAKIELDNRQYHPAFTRDISAPGIGLLHRVPIDPGEITVHIPFPSGTLAQRTLIVWCRDVGDGWYASGGRFLDALAPE
jgi:hypothetical protein